MEIEAILGHAMIFLIVGLLGIFIVEELYENKACDEACNDLGMKEAFNYNFKPDYCVDYNSLAHQAIFECEGFAWTMKCKANLIAINQLRGKADE